MLSLDLTEKIKAELQALDNENVQVEDKSIKPSSCYYFGSNPAHILYNTNCPDSLKEKINAIISKYVALNESGTF